MPRHPPCALSSLTCSLLKNHMCEDVLHLIQFLMYQNYQELRGTRGEFMNAKLYQFRFNQASVFTSTFATLPCFNLASNSRLSSLTSPVGLSGLEPLTPALSAQCSNLLSYRPLPNCQSPFVNPQLSMKYMLPHLLPLTLSLVAWLLTTARGVHPAVYTPPH